MGAQHGAGDGDRAAAGRRGTPTAPDPGRSGATGGSLSVQEPLVGVVEDPRDSAGHALARRGSLRRWPWAVGAAVAGAAAAAATVVVTRRLFGRDAAGTQEPEQLRAVVDLGIEPPVPYGPETA